MKDKRQDIILREVRLHNKVLLNDMAEMLDVSPDTIRRDIIELDSQNKLKRIHGGAQAITFRQYNSHEIFFHDEKKKIATKAAHIVQNNSVSLISGGTTNLEFVCNLPLELSATFFTPSLPLAMQLLNHGGIEVILLGGKVSRSAQIALGGNVLNTLRGIKFDNCFLGTSYLDSDRGLTEAEWEIVQLKKAMISSSSRVISLTISQKLGTVQRFSVCDLDDIDILVTDLEPNDIVLQPYRDQGIEIL
ncbi:MAG: DeoR/GlpR family DNA-binding transcription regulator [Bacteroidota bacterium]